MAYLAFGIGAIADQLFPGFQVGIARGQAQHDGHFLVKALLIKLEGHFINVVYVHRREHGVLVHIAEQGDLAAQLFGDALLAAAEDDVRLNADGEQLFDAVLGGLGLVLTRRAQVGHQGEVDVQAIVAAQLRTQLADGLQKRQAFNVAHGAADFDDGHVWRVIAFSQRKHHALNLIGDVGNHLHRGAQIVAVALFAAPVFGKKPEGYDESLSIGKVKCFYGNFLVALRAAVYIDTLGAEGIKDAAQKAVLNANYLMEGLKEFYPVAYDRVCMHEFVLTLENLKHEKGVSAMDVAKAMLDYGIHPPTMYFPLIVHEDLMFEPTETETKETLDEAIRVLGEIRQIAEKDAQSLHEAPHKTIIGRVDEVRAARQPVLKYAFND